MKKRSLALKKRSIALLAWMCTVPAAACEGDGLVEPFISRVVLLPAEAALFTAAPDRSVQLTIEAYDVMGRLLPDPGAATYYSSAPLVAEVSSGGLVHAVAPGTAEITATVTRGGRTTESSMVVTVRYRSSSDRDAGWGDIIGVYDLTGMVTSFDPAWGDLTGYRYDAVITFVADSSQKPGIGGAFRDLRVTGPEGTQYFEVPHGMISSSFDWPGRLVLELGSNFTVLPAGDVRAPLVEGSFGVGGHISGSFTASRRERVGSGPLPFTIPWYGSAWHPQTMDVVAGDTVIWQLFDGSGDPAPAVLLVGDGNEQVPLMGGLARYVFATPGEYQYCTSNCWDYGYGVVRVAPPAEGNDK